MSYSEVVESHADGFQILVKQNLAESRINVSEAVQQYLSDLLQFYILTDHLFSSISSSGKKQIETLAQMYFQAYISSVRRKYMLKKLGDTSLYISGFFGESLKRKSVSANYYINMGQRAYQILAIGEQRDLFEELADRFVDLIFVLCRIRQQSGTTNSYVLSLLNQYMENHQPQVAKELLRYGINISLKDKGPLSH